MPTFTFTSPEGKSFDVSGPDGSTQEQAFAILQQQGHVPAPHAATPPPGLLKAGMQGVNEGIAGTLDMFGNAPTNLWNLAKAGAGTVATAAGRPDMAPDISPTPNYAARALEALGATKPENAPQRRAERMAAAMGRGASSLAMGPARSAAEMLRSAAIGAGSGASAQGTTEATGSQALGDTVGILTPVAAAGASNLAAKRAQAMQQGRNEVRNATLTEGRDAGYVTPPTTGVNTGVKGWVNRQLESIGGKAAMKQESSLRNADNTQKLAAEELGFPPDTALTQSKLNDYREQVSAPYREVAGLNRYAAITLKELRLTREKINDQYDAINKTGDINAKDTVAALRKEATFLEQKLDAFAVSAGKPELVDALRDARTKIAKSYDIERSLNVGSADVSAPKLGAMIDKNKPLTGNLETIGRFQQAYPQFMGDAPRVPNPGVSATNPMAAMLLGGGGAALAGGPAGAIAGGLPLLREPVRSLLLSKLYQKTMATRGNSPGTSKDEAALRSLLMARQLTEQQGVTP